MDCPGSLYADPAIRNQYPNYTVVNTSIPLESSGPYVNLTDQNTIAGPMDITYRNFYNDSNIYIDNSEANVVGILQPFETFLLDNSQYRVIEGAIVDTVNGGIGLRNHTLPTNLRLGAQWQEDILWILPETACTSLNLSLHFSISDLYFYDTKYGYMRDDGGFANLSSEAPQPRWDGPDHRWQDVFGSSPDLQHRWYTLAWWNNQFTAQALNVSSSVLGQTFTEGFSDYGGLASPSSITISEANGWYVNHIKYSNDTGLAKNFTAYGRRCSGYDEDHPSNSSKPYVRCGYLYGVPYPSQESQGQLYRYGLNSNWTQDLYTCASSMKASVRTTTFRANATNSTALLNDLHVVNVQPKSCDNTDLPRWGVEKANGYRIEDINLFGGLVNSESSNIEIQRAAEMYLPAATFQTTFGHLGDSFAAGTAFAASWNSVYEYAAAVSGVAIDFIPSYSGENNYGLTLKYRELSKTPEDAAKILNLIWTDLAAFIAVGSKTGFELDGKDELHKRDAQSTYLGHRDVHRMVRVIEYRDWRYAIPAFVVGALFLLGLISAVILGCCRTVTWRSLNHYVNQTAMGRAVTQTLNPAPPYRAEVSAKTKQWSNTAGQLELEVPHAPKPPASSSVPRDRRPLRRHYRDNSGAESSRDDVEMSLRTG